MRLCGKDRQLLAGPSLWGPMSSFLHGVHHLPYLFWVRIGGGGVGSGWGEGPGGRLEAWSPRHTPNSAPGSWARVTEGRKKRASEDGHWEEGAE